jgi:hypothetical protein
MVAMLALALALALTEQAPCHLQKVNGFKELCA